MATGNLRVEYNVIKCNNGMLKRELNPCIVNGMLRIDCDGSNKYNLCEQYKITSKRRAEV